MVRGFLPNWLRACQSLSEAAPGTDRVHASEEEEQAARASPALRTDADTCRVADGIFDSVALV